MQIFIKGVNAHIYKRSKKCERIYLNEYETIKNLQEDVDDYIEFYNDERFHETLKYKKPMKIYQEEIKACLALSSVS